MNKKRYSDFNKSFFNLADNTVNTYEVKSEEANAEDVDEVDTQVNEGTKVFEEDPVVSVPSGKKTVKVSIDNLNIRKGPGKIFERTGEFTGIGTFTLTEIVEGNGSDKGWGKLESGKGWISLDFCEE